MNFVLSTMFLLGSLSAQSSYTIWPGTAVPALADSGPDSAVELGVQFRADVSGTITGVRFYKASTNTGTHVANLWSSTGSKLATATFSGETASGWQQVSFSKPVSVTASTVYVASYHTNVGHYADDVTYFATQGVDTPPLHALADGVSGVNGRYAYGSASKFPNLGWQSSNYWVDVVFSTTGGGDTTPPTVTAFTIPATATTLTVPITAFTAADNVGVTGFLVTTSATTPSATASGWSATAPGSYTVTSAGANTLYAWAKDAAGNVSASRSATVTVTLADTTPPTVTAFSIPATATTLTVPITAFTATDNVGVTGYLVTESATPPSATATGWSATAPGSYTFTSAGAKTLYAWAKDAASNVSASKKATVTITLADTTPPTVTAFTIPATATTLTVPITTFTATDNVAVTGYLITETATTPSATASGWSATAPGSYTFTSAGAKTLYAWAKDAASNVSASKKATVTITLADTTPPTVTAFTIPATATTLTVPITTFTATDNVGVTGYFVSESAATPSATASGWSATAPASYSFTSAGAKTLYAWAKDAAGNVSARVSASVTITIPAGGPEPAGWYAGDIHVHRSCGGAPEALSSMYARMSPQNLSVISLLADMGNGEVQNATTDLPLVNGQDASVSTPGKIVHWDTEWHWDATYSQYPHQALGGHIVALGLTQAQQIWQEYTYPIFNWAHQQGAIAGFAHMERLDGNLPQNLDCCIPIEYPVEVALGSSDFISEDVTDVTSTQGMCPDCAIQAYYRLLNTGFRPGYAAGTDYPCNSGEDLGTLLTYVQVAGGQLTYGNWVQGIAKGRTVVSRNGHNEFMDLVVNNSATPGDEIKLTGPGSVPAAVTWTATQSLTGTIELIQNGVVVASQQASAGPGAPASLNTQVSFTSSGWLAARRMGPQGHYLQTAAVFVSVNNSPVRASASDAQFFVAWMDTLLTNTSPGGVWNSYFPTSLSQAQARYQSAKAIYQQIALDACAGPTTPTIFTCQTPTLFENESPYELGTRFWADVNGAITQVRVYASANEGGNHLVRIWRASDGALLAGPYTWNITAGTEGWKTFTLSPALSIAANTDYIVAVANSSDHYYAEQEQGFAAPIVNGHLNTYIGSGVYGTVLGAMPTSAWNNTNYFRDVVFAPQ